MEEILHHANHLWNLSCNSLFVPSLSAFYMNTLSATLKQNRLKIDPDLASSLCESCGGFLIPGTNCTLKAVNQLSSSQGLRRRKIRQNYIARFCHVCRGHALKKIKTKSTFQQLKTERKRFLAFNFRQGKPRYSKEQKKRKNPSKKTSQAICLGKNEEQKTKKTTKGNGPLRKLPKLNSLKEQIVQEELKKQNSVQSFKLKDFLKSL
eukprot:TRINITY_DN2646_c0_g1_i1.p1 TRINITY_DN2646_c0_g1~~TRINITY_DN2646_c0_g1_i1.p1  ORF type:complete len:207 (-),score=18.69 TRINITY_DN2646_c0_g1_i1:69-689(-)